ncbi:MAG: glycerol-3-phosphate 1-O-acyltransferase PlsY [Alistipes sp.]|nr:glycerol-3-phosphate 1-O-acyltransferase PlsY [Alistipes sp.]MBO7194961.1 glycerol-3-phosphate 1-O-acyltransferase PlsY [Alistipes sp.]
MASWSVITYYCVLSMLIMAYLLGSIPSAVWIGKKYYGIDIREHGSKNAGTTNMLRVLGKRAAIPVFVLDFFKGFAAVSLMSLMRYDPEITSAWLINLKILGVFVAVLGHIFPIFADFKGGKGVATLVGAITGIYPQIILLCFAVWALVFMFSNYVSLASMTAGCCFPLFVIIYSSSEWSRSHDVSFTFILFSFVVAGLLIWSHRKNIERLKAGTESKIYIWSKPPQKDE